MKYKIGDISKHFGISDQMIRYYEKYGVIQPERSGEGNYRYYTDLDIFKLFDAIRIRELGVNISGINTILTRNDVDMFVGHIDKLERNLENEIIRKQVLLKQIKKIRKKLTLSRYRTNSVCVEIFPAYVLFFMGTSNGKNFDIHQLDERMTKIIYSPEYILFFDPYGDYIDGNGEWWFAIEKEQLETLSLPVYGKHRIVEEQMVLLTVDYVREMEIISPDACQRLYDYAAENHFEVTGPPGIATINLRKKDDPALRLVQHSLPVKSL